MTDYRNQYLGDYHLVQLIGEGGFGKVYLAEHKYDKTKVAIKVLNKQLVNQEQLREFLKEVRTFRLHHPHIVKILDFDIEADNTPYIVMQYASNGTLLRRHPTAVGRKVEPVIK